MTRRVAPIGPACALALAAALALAGCGPRGALTVDPEAAAVGAAQPIYVATARLADGGPNVWAEGRSEAVSFARFEVSVPPGRAPGTVTFPRRLPPDPATDFLTISARGFADEAAFVAAVNARMDALPRENREVFLFTHGFNTTFSEGLYRHAQMREDFGTPGLAVHYSWPSAGSVTAYAYDRESAIFAREGLRQTLAALARTRAEHIVVAGHSMGAMVLMEALRGMALAGAPDFFARLQAVVLMAPDLDIDVFRGQIAPLAARDVPVYIFFSSRDRALRFSSILRGDSERLGSIRDLARLDGLPVTLIDTTGVNDGEDALGHFAVATSPAMISLIRGMDRVGAEIFVDAANSPNPVEQTINVFQGVGDAVLSPLAQ